MVLFLQGWYFPSDASRYTVEQKETSPPVVQQRVGSIEEGFKLKPRQRSSRLFGGQIPCRTSYFASVVLKAQDDFNRFFQNNRGKIVSAAKNMPPPPKKNRRDDLYLGFCLNHSSMVGRPFFAGYVLPQIMYNCTCCVQCTVQYTAYCCYLCPFQNELLLFVLT